MDIGLPLCFRYGCLKIILVCTIIPFQASGEALPQDFDYSRYTEWLLDRGELWEYNSLIHPLDVIIFDSLPTFKSTDWVVSRWLDFPSRVKGVLSPQPSRFSVLAYTGTGFEYQGGKSKEYSGLAVQPFLWTHTKISPGFYARIYARATNRVASLEHFTGVSRDIARIGLNAGEIDQGVVGFENKYITADFGRSREIWGPITENDLILSGSAPSWERLAIELRYRSFNARWFYGFLETIPSKSDDNANVQRYIVGRILQYRNSSGIILGLGEVMILAGVNRSLDWSHFNPLAFGLEVEYNHRSNNPNQNGDNGIRFLSIDKMFRCGLRFCGSVIVDEFKFEHSEVKRGEPDHLGWQGRVSWSRPSQFGWITLYGSYVRVDTYTYQHSYGYTNFVTRSHFLGYPLGNDADEISLGGRFVMNIPVAIELTYYQRRWGENSLAIDDRYYKPLLKSQDRTGPFPSGIVQWRRSIFAEFHYQPKAWLRLSLTGDVATEKFNHAESPNLWTLQIYIQIPIILMNI